MVRTKTTRYIDAQGRIILPAHIRKALNLTEGRCVELDIEEDGSLRLRPTEERCHICGRVTSFIPSMRVHEKIICCECAKEIAERTEG